MSRWSCMGQWFVDLFFFFPSKRGHTICSRDGSSDVCSSDLTHRRYMTWLVQNLWLVPALPLLAAGVTALSRRPQRRIAATMAIGSMFLAFGLSCWALVTSLGAHAEAPGGRQTYNFNWLQFGD